jgi:DNA/RNA endonuclease G (NUC1)
MPTRQEREEANRLLQSPNREPTPAERWAAFNEIFGTTGMQAIASLPGIIHCRRNIAALVNPDTDRAYFVQQSLGGDYGDDVDDIDRPWIGGGWYEKGNQDERRQKAEDKTSIKNKYEIQRGHLARGSDYEDHVKLKDDTYMWWNQIPQFGPTFNSFYNLSEEVAAEWGIDFKTLEHEYWEDQRKFPTNWMKTARYSGYQNDGCWSVIENYLFNKFAVGRNDNDRCWMITGPLFFGVQMPDFEKNNTVVEIPTHIFKAGLFQKHDSCGEITWTFEAFLMQNRLYTWRERYMMQTDRPESMPFVPRGTVVPPPEGIDKYRIRLTELENYAGFPIFPNRNELGAIEIGFND